MWYKNSDRAWPVTAVACSDSHVTKSLNLFNLNVLYYQIWYLDKTTCSLTWNLFQVYLDKLQKYNNCDKPSLPIFLFTLSVKMPKNNKTSCTFYIRGVMRIRTPPELHYIYSFCSGVISILKSSWSERIPELRIHVNLQLSIVSVSANRNIIYLNFNQEI